MKFIPIIFIALLPTFVMADDLYTTTIVDGCGDAYYYMAVLEPITYTCAAGTFLPAGALACVQCPNGYTCNGGTFTFDANHAQGLEEGDVLLMNAIGSCSKEFPSNYSAIFEPITYICSAGTYLPADAIECIQCPPNSYCPGGTYAFNETTAQGINPCPNNQTSLAGSSSVDQCKTVNLTWVSNGETYTTTTCTINGLITLPEPPIRAGYTFTGWKLQTNE